MKKVRLPKVGQIAIVHDEDDYSSTRLARVINIDYTNEMMSVIFLDDLFEELEEGNVSFLYLEKYEGKVIL
ncbi:MAG: hypothetical protein J6X03_03305 [Bacilli bacterium]|nr:hypothetical protein [Bacilli bacterium]